MEKFERTTQSVRELIVSLGGKVEHDNPKGWLVEFPKGTRRTKDFTTNVPYSDSIAIWSWRLPNGVGVHYDVGSSDDSHVLAIDR